MGGVRAAKYCALEYRELLEEHDAMYRWVNEAQDKALEAMAKAGSGFWDDIGKRLSSGTNALEAAVAYREFESSAECHPDDKTVRKNRHAFLDVVVRLLCYDFGCTGSREAFKNAACWVFRRQGWPNASLIGQLDNSYRKTTANMSEFCSYMNRFPSTTLRRMPRTRRERNQATEDFWLL